MLKERRSLNRRLADAIRHTLDALEDRVLYCADLAHGTGIVVQPYGPGIHQSTGVRGGIATFAPLSSVPVLNSNPGAQATVYLDFNGDVAQSWGSYNVPATPAFDQDNDTTTFSDSELTAIQQIWARVSEAYSPFNVNVTTVDPGSYGDKQALKLVFGGAGAWLGSQAGGVSYVGSFSNSAPNVAWIFTKNLGNGTPKYTGDAAIHESGHAMGLVHQSSYSGTSKTAEYRGGDMYTAPFMGVSYYSTRGKWSNGQSSSGYNVYQDDLSILAGSANGYGYRPDDHGNTIGTADALTVNGASVSASGIINNTSDIDAFSFTTSAGTVNFSVNVAANGAMLDATLKLVDLNGNVIASSDTASLSESISATVTEGSYRLLVLSKGTYGDIGQYTISGTIVPSGTYVAPPSNVTATAVSGGVNVAWYDNSWNETGFTVERSDDNGQTWNTLTTADPNAIAYVDTTASVGSTYQYRVTAFNADETSAASNVATISVTPSAPGSLSATSISKNRIDLTWSDVTGESGYIIERSLNGTTFTQLATTSADATSYSDTTAAAGTRYYYRVRATSTVGASSNSNVANATTRVTGATTLSAVVYSSTQINLSWTNVLNETGYRIEKSTDGQTWSTLGTTGANVITYTSTLLTPGTQYYYRVYALNAGGDSEAATTNATTVLASPTGLTATATSTTEIHLAWTDSTGETGYKVERTTDGKTYALIATLDADTTEYSNTSLTAGTSYIYRIKAINAGGDSAASTAVTTVTIPMAPVVTANPASDSTITLAWTNVAGETGYVIERSENGQDGWTQLAITQANIIGYNNTQLTANTPWYYRVKSRNASGDSAYSGVVATKTLVAPVAGLALTATSTTVNLNWTDSTGETSYKIERSLNNLTWVALATTDADAVTYTDSSLTPGTLYYYRVKALNSAGASLVPLPATITTIPPRATVLASALSTTQISLSWTNVPGETGYHIERTLDGQTWSLLTNVTANTISYLNTGLDADTTYTYRVTPFNAAGDAAASEIVSKRTLQFAPTGLTATATSTTAINLSWADNTNETGYVVEQSINGSVWVSVAQLNADTTTFSKTSLTPGTLYYYRVRALNSGGQSLPSTAATATTIPPKTTLAATAVSPTQINLTWTNVTGETGYRIQRSSDGQDWTTLTTTAANVVSFINTQLTENTMYYYKVTPTSAAGDAESTITQKTTLVSAPTGLAATGASTIAINLSWNPVTGATGYKIERYNGKSWIQIATADANSTTYQNTALVANHSYMYRIKATNPGGDSAYSSIVTGTTLASSKFVKPSFEAFQHKKPINDLLDAA